jgi:hypothetical protein
VKQEDRTEPAHFNPVLSIDRIDLLASVLKFVYEDALNDMVEAKGDSDWTLGCTSYERACAAIKAAAESGKFPWLGIVDPSMHFVFSIQGIHVRFSRGDQDGRPSANVMKNVSQEAALTQQYLSIYDPEAAKCVWRFIVNRNDEKMVERIEFSLVDTNGVSVFTWNAPFNGDVSTVLEWAKKTQYVKQEPADVPGIVLGRRKKKSKPSEGSA